MKRINRRILKNMFKRKTLLLTCLTFIVLSVIITSGYAILKTNLSLSGNSSINPDNQKPLNTKSLVITNKNATLTLGKSEKQVTTYTLKKNNSYIAENPNEKQYVLTIKNKTNKNYIGIKANIYLGNKNKLSSITPVPIIYEYDNNVTLEMPPTVQIQPSGTYSIYINIITKNDDFTPDIVISTLIDT